MSSSLFTVSFCEFDVNHLTVWKQSKGASEQKRTAIVTKKRKEKKGISLISSAQGKKQIPNEAWTLHLLFCLDSHPLLANQLGGEHTQVAFVLHIF